MSFAERLRLLRTERQLSQVQVAAGIGIAWRNYQRLEAQTSLPNYRNLLALADFFQVSLDYLAGRTDRREVNRCGATDAGDPPVRRQALNAGRR